MKYRLGMNPGGNINNLIYADNTMLITEESEKAALKLNIQKTMITTSGPISSWQTDGETEKTVESLFFWAPKSLQMVTAAMKLKDAYSLEEKL